MKVEEYNGSIVNLINDFDDATTIQEKIILFQQIQQIAKNAVQCGISWLPEEERSKYAEANL